MIFRFEKFCFDSAARELSCDGEVRPIEPQILVLLELLLENSGRMVSKSEIIEHVWNGRTVSDGSINGRIKLLRKALDDDGRQQRLIKTHHGQGFRFVGELVGTEADDRAFAPEEVVDSHSAAVVPPTPKTNAAQRSIAVLPFENMSSDPEQEYFADGLVEDILTVLAKIPRLHVIARNSSFVYKGKAVDIREAGRAMGATCVLEGSLRNTADRLRITAQLIDVETGTHLWADRYDREIGDVFAVQDEMTREIVSALQIHLSAGEQARLWAKGTKNHAAWERMIQARMIVFDQHPASMDRAEKLIDQALQLDENYTEAYTWKGTVHWMRLKNGWADDPAHSLQQVKINAEKALALDDEFAFAYFLQAFLHLVAQSYDEAVASIDKAVELLSPFHDMRAYAAMIYIFADRLDRAQELFASIITHNPVYEALVPACMAWLHIAKADYEAAYDAASEVLEMGHDNQLNFAMLAIACANLGKEDAVLQAREASMRLDPHFSISRFASNQPFKNPEALDRFVSGLRKAGFPA